MSEAAVAQVLADYYRAFSTLDIAAILPFFHEPAVLMGPPGVYAAPNSAALAAMLAPGIEDLRSRGYDRSELSIQQLRLLSATAALTTGVAIRYKSDGQELERVGVTYLLHRAETGWKIAVLVLHDIGGAVRSE